MTTSQSSGTWRQCWTWAACRASPFDSGPVRPPGASRWTSSASCWSTDCSTCHTEYGSTPDSSGNSGSSAGSVGRSRPRHRKCPRLGRRATRGRRTARRPQHGVPWVHPTAAERHICAYRGPAFHSETPEPASDQDGGGHQGSTGQRDAPGEAAIALHLSAAGAVFERLIILCAFLPDMPSDAATQRLPHTPDWAPSFHAGPGLPTLRGQCQKYCPVMVPCGRVSRRAGARGGHQRTI